MKTESVRQIINYDLAMQKTIKGFAEGEKPSLLLHSCCAPCSTAVVERLMENFCVTVFYFNPNITESEEYNLRLNEQKRYLKETYGDAVKIIEGRYSAREFFAAATGLEKEPEGGKRCEACFELRLNETAKIAKEGGYRYFCTTLTVSPHKNAELINEIGTHAGERYGVEFLPSDFKKRGGFKRSCELSEKSGLYRQNYCGCIYSKYAHIKSENEE